MQTILIVDDDTAIGDLEQEVLGFPYTPVGICQVPACE